MILISLFPRSFCLKSMFDVERNIAAIGQRVKVGIGLANIIEIGETGRPGGAVDRGDAEAE